MRLRERRLAATAVCLVLAALWIVAAWSKLVEPVAAYEFSARVVGGGLPAKAAVTGQVLVEALLGVAMLLGAVRGLRVSLAALLALTGVLLWVKSDAGGAVQCGCFLALVESDVDDALVRNGVLVVVAALAAIVDVRPRPDAPEPAA
jgi:hypothetical protein